MAIPILQMRKLRDQIVKEDDGKRMNGLEVGFTPRQSGSSPRSLCHLEGAQAKGKPVTQPALPMLGLGQSGRGQSSGVGAICSHCCEAKHPCKSLPGPALPPAAGLSCLQGRERERRPGGGDEHGVISLVHSGLCSRVHSSGACSGRRPHTARPFSLFPLLDGQQRPCLLPSGVLLILNSFVMCWLSTYCVPGAIQGLGIQR